MGYKNAIDRFMVKNKDKNILLVFDVSGSYEAEWEQKEIANYINKTKPLTVIYADWEVQGITDTLKLKKPENIGGGTSFKPAFQWAKENGYDAIIYSTDGFGDLPKEEVMPTLWLLDAEDSTDEYISWGETVKTEIRGFDIEKYFDDPKNFIVKIASTNEKVVEKAWIDIPAYEIHSTDIILMKRALAKINNHPPDNFTINTFPGKKDLIQFLDEKINSAFSSMGNCITVKENERTLEWTQNVEDYYLLYNIDTKEYCILSRKRILD